MQNTQRPWNPSRKDRVVMLALIIIAGSLAMKPVAAQNLYMQGVYLEGFALYEHAQKKYEKALIFDPYLTDALYALALSYEETSKENKSIAYCLRVIAKKPQYFPCYDVMARTYFRQRNFKALILTVKPIMQMTVSKDEIITLKLLGTSYEKTGDSENAKKAWEKILTLQPNDGLAKSKL